MSERLLLLLHASLTHLIDGLHGEVERHELHDGTEAVEGGSDGQPGETDLRDRSVLDTVVAVLLPQTARNL